MHCLSLLSFVLAALAFVTACENKKQIKDDQSKPTKAAFPTASVADQDSQAPETVSPPTNIMGSYLFCREAGISFDDEKAESIGCNIYETKTGARVDAKSIGKDIEWSYDRSRLNALTRVSVFKATPEQQMPYLVYFSFLSPTDNLAESLSRFVIEMTVLKDAASKTRYVNDTFLTKPEGAALPDDELPIASLPDAVSL